GGAPVAVQALFVGLPGIAAIAAIFGSEEAIALCDQPVARHDARLPMRAISMEIENGRHAGPRRAEAGAQFQPVAGRIGYGFEARDGLSRCHRRGIDQPALGGIDRPYQGDVDCGRRNQQRKQQTPPSIRRRGASAQARASSTPALLWRSAASTVSTICGALSPARSYIFSGVSWSMNRSGRRSVRIFSPQSVSPSSLAIV